MINDRLTAFVLMLALLASCAETKQEEATPRSVETMVVSAGSDIIRSTLPAKVRAEQEAQLSFRVAGQISQIFAEPGKPVRRGELLAQLDTRDYSAQLSATEAEYRSVKAQAERIIELHKTGSVSTNDYDKAVGALGQITEKLNAHRNTLSYTRLIAPYDGYVQESLRKRGETVGAGMTVMTLFSGSTPVVELDLSASDYLERAQFDRFSCTSDAFPGEVFPLELVSIDPIANLNQLHTMRLRFASDMERYPSVGMSVTVSIERKAGDDRAEQGAAVNLPLGAVYEREGKSYVWVVEEGKVRAQAIRIEQVLHSGHVVARGLQAGQEVAVGGASSLSEGEQVSPLPKVSETNVGKLL